MLTKIGVYAQRSTQQEIQLILLEWVNIPLHRQPGWVGDENKILSFPVFFRDIFYDWSVGKEKIFQKKFSTGYQN